jgi:hypothetical protein
MGTLLSLSMDHKTLRNTAVPQNKAQDKKRADALRQNLLKRKQQTRARHDSTPSSPQEK